MVSQSFIPDSCPEGSVPNFDDCVNINECELWQPCSHGGRCRDLEADMGGYVCDCVDGYYGTDCKIKLEETILKPSTDFVVAIVICILLLLSKFFILFF